MRTGAYFKMSGQKAEETAANGLHPGRVSGILYKVRQGRGEQNVSFDFAERVFCLPVPFFESAPEGLRHCRCCGNASFFGQR